MESWKHDNTLGTTGPCMAGPAATLRPLAQGRHTAFVKDRFPSRPCDARRAPQQLTDRSCGRCRPASDPRTGHPSRGRRCRFDSRTPRRADSPGRPGPQGGSRCRAGTTLNPQRLRTDTPDRSRTPHEMPMPQPEGTSVPGEPDDGPAPPEPPHSPAGRSRRNVRRELPGPATPRSSIMAIVEDVRHGEEITEGVRGARAPSSMNTCGVASSTQ